MEHNVPIPLNGHIQHHPGIHGVISRGQSGKTAHFGALQLCHKAHSAHIHPQKRDALPGRSLCHMQNGAVTAEADHHFRIGQLPIQPAEPNVPGQLIGTVDFKGQADLCLHPCIFQDPLGLPYRLKILIPIGIGGQYHVFHSCSPLLSVSCACRTTKAVSG